MKKRNLTSKNRAIIGVEAKMWSFGPDVSFFVVSFHTGIVFYIKLNLSSIELVGFKPNKHNVDTC